MGFWVLLLMVFIMWVLEWGFLVYRLLWFWVFSRGFPMGLSVGLGLGNRLLRFGC